MSLEGKVALITGAGSGFGEGMAKRFASGGAKVVIVDRDKAGAERVAGEIGDAALAVAADISKEADVDAAVEAALSKFGKVDILINNAGIAPNGQNFADMAPESFDRILSINLVGIFNGVSTFAAAMRERGRGYILNTSSQAGLNAAIPGVGAYAVAKFGVTALSENLRIELEPHGVSVSVLCPGYVQTNLAANTVRVGGDIRKYTATMPASDVTSDDVGQMVLRGIEANAPYILTHGGAWPGIEKRMKAIQTACELAEGA